MAFQNGLPTCVLPESPCPSYPTVVRDPDEAIRDGFSCPDEERPLFGA
jgi:hypothetical protein